MCRTRTYGCLLIALLVVGWVPHGLPPAADGRCAAAEEAAPHDGPVRPGSWGFRPADGSTSPVTPPAFVWRTQRGTSSYTLQCARAATFDKIAYEATDIEYNCHCPPKALAPGRWYWRYRFVSRSGRSSNWSKPRRFTIPTDAVKLPMPNRAELLGRIPRTHPRLFIRPEDLPKLRQHAKTDLKHMFERLVKRCEQLLKSPPATEEPPKYPKGTVRGSEAWRSIWWPNRVRTGKVLNGAATLGFTRLLGGKEEYGQLAKRLLLAAAEWDPKGATGYRYNDEAGMPYAYYFARTYTFINDLLTEAEKDKCRRVMRVRGLEMYHHLCPRHLWYPYASHSNRAWHFLGEVGIAFLGEIPEAAEWAWFAMNVFHNVYPAWCDADGGWHEGAAYWNSYVSRFTWWADVMRTAMGVNAYDKPYFSKVGYYPIYLQPPGTVGGGFGDQTGWRKSAHNRRLMTTLAAQARNGHWRWYVDAHGGPDSEGGYIGFIRGILPDVQPTPPTNLPSSRCFHGIGQAMLNTNLLDAKQNVEIVFKSSPFGTQSHGYESNNAFLLYAFGERLLIRTGRRDIHGSKHHTRWMHHTKSTNCITIDGRSQIKHTAMNRGKIAAFCASPKFDYVCGEAGEAYGEQASRFTRHILFVKPELVVIFDCLETPKPATFEWWLHALNEMDLRGQRDIMVSGNSARCRVSFLAPDGLQVAQTNRFDPPPRPRVKLVQWHLTAATPKPATRCEFVTLLRPHRAAETLPSAATIEKTSSGYRVKAALKDGHVLVGLKTTDTGKLQLAGIDTRGAVTAVRLDAKGTPTDTFNSK